MDIVKDDSTRQFDELTQLADETLDFYRDLVGRLEDETLRARLGACVDEQDRRLERLVEHRRARDQMPQTGDPERAHLRALWTEIGALLTPGKSDAHIVEALLEAAARVRETLDHASATEPSDAQAQLLGDFERSCADFERALRDQTR